MFNPVGKNSPAGSQATQVVNTPINTGGAGSAGGLLSQEKDAKEAATGAKFGEVYNQIKLNTAQNLAARPHQSRPDVEGAGRRSRAN